MIEGQEYICEDCEATYIGRDICDCGGYLINPETNQRAEDEGDEE